MSDRVVRGGLFDRVVYLNHETWLYWVQRQTDGHGRVSYTVYKEWPQTIPGNVDESFGSYEDAVDYIKGIWSDK